MTKQTFTSKSNGDTLSASEWNDLTSYINTAVDEINSNGNSGSGTGNITVGNPTGNSHMYINDKGNLCIETTENNVPSGKKGKINIEAKDDIQIKPGDDVIFTSSHRPIENLDEVSMKIHDGEDHPVKLQLNAADIVLTTKDKSATKTKDAETGEDTQVAMYDDPTVMNITVNSAKNTRGYLKVRAQAIDLRSESHGGIALQPKGYDGDLTPHMNKIKFEHGGGDGLEFGTFNTEHTSLYTNDYRFKKDGLIKLSTRTPVARATDGTDSKYDANDDTTHYTYTKQADDFYDVIDNNDPTCTWNDILVAVNYIKSQQPSLGWSQSA